MNLDDELAKAIQDEPSEPSSLSTQRMRNAPKPKRNLGLLIGLVMIAVAVLALIPLSFQGSAVWATSVEQLLADESLAGRRVRVEGTLVRGSLMRRDQPCEFRFKLQTNESVVSVHYPQCVIPDTLQDRPEADVQVTAEGSLQPDGTFRATQVLAKCPSKYEEKDGKLTPVGQLEYR